MIKYLSVTSKICSFICHSSPSIRFYDQPHFVCLSSLPTMICAYELSFPFAQFGYSKKRDIVIVIVRKKFC